MNKDQFLKVIEVMVEEMQRKDTTICLLKMEVNKLKEAMEKGAQNNGSQF